MKTYIYLAICFTILSTQGCMLTQSGVNSNSNVMHFYANNKNISESVNSAGDLALYSTDATKRINIIAKEERYSTTPTTSSGYFLRYCPEFTPIAASNQGTSESLNVAIKELIEIGKSGSNINVVSKLQERSGGVQFYEQGLFALCVAALNQWIETSDNPQTSQLREDCKNSARALYVNMVYDKVHSNITPKDTSLLKMKMPEVCLTEYERTLYRLRDDTRDILMLEAAFDRDDDNEQDGNYIDKIKEILDKGGIVEYLQDEQLKERERKVKQREEAIEKKEEDQKSAAEKFEYNKEIYELQRKRDKEQEALDKTIKERDYNVCLQNNSNDVAKCVHHLR